MPTAKRIDAPGILWPQRYRVAILRASNTRAAIDHIATTITDDVQVERLAEASAALVEIEIRSTTNPSGPGHNWVMQRYRLPLPGFPSQTLGALIDDAKDDKGNLEPPRRYIHATVEENLLMMASDPEYINRLCAGATSEAQYQAFRFGDWSIVAGGMFDDIWPKVRERCVVPPFLHRVPPVSWRITHAFDPGSAKPFSYQIFAESDGSDVEFADGTIRSTIPGDLFLCFEWYGWNGRPNVGLRHLTVPDIAEGIRKRWKEWGIDKRVRPGPSDIGIFDEQNGFCAAEEFAKRGVHFEKAAKGPFSRVEGWAQMRMRLAATVAEPGRPRETPGLFIVGENCPQWLRTVPVLPRKEDQEDDVDSEAEDHNGDCTRYRLRFDGGPRVSFRRRTT
jgi:hypothetical protein